MTAIRKAIRDIQVGDDGSLSINDGARYLRWKPGRPYVLLSGLYTHDQLRAVANHIVEHGGDEC